MAVSSTSWKPGQAPPGAGRPKGSQDKIPRDFRKMIADMLEAEIPYMIQAFEELRAQPVLKKLPIYEKFLNFVIPKMTQSDVTVNEAPINVIVPLNPEEEED